MQACVLSSYASDRRDEEVEADVVAAITLGRRYNARLFINDYWRLAIKHQAYGVHLGQEDLQATDLSAIRAAGLRLGVSTHDDMEIDVALAARPLISRWDMCSRRKPNRCLLHRRGWNSWHGMLSAWRIIPPWRLAVSVWRAPAVMATGVGSIAVVSAITRRRLAFGNGTVAGNCRSWR